MLKKDLLVLMLLFLTAVQLHGQTKQFIRIDNGINLLPNSSDKAQFGHNLGVKYGVIIGKESLTLTPSIGLVRNRFGSSVSENSDLLISQNSCVLSAKVGVPITKAFSLQMGLFTNYVFDDKVSYRFKSFGAVTNTPSELHSSGNPNKLQAGVSIGSTFIFGRKERLLMSVSLSQHINEVFSEDYKWSFFEYDERVVFREGQKPTALIVGVGCVF